LGCALVAGRTLVPSPAAGITALRILKIITRPFLNFFVTNIHNKILAHKTNALAL
jgi:hypothetical protein